MLTQMIGQFRQAGVEEHPNRPEDPNPQRAPDQGFWLPVDVDLSDPSATGSLFLHYLLGRYLN